MHSAIKFMKQGMLGHGSQPTMLSYGNGHTCIHTPTSACFVRHVFHTILLITWNFVLNNSKNLNLFYEPIFSKIRDYFSRIFDSTDDYKTTVPPNDESYKLIKPVLKVYRGQNLEATLETNPGLYTQQCQFFKRIKQSFGSWWGHLGKWKVKEDHHMVWVWMVPVYPSIIEIIADAPGESLRWG